MFFSKVWKAWDRRLRPFTLSRPRRRKEPRPQRLFLEALEERWLLTSWTAIGPAPILNGQTPGNTPVSGRVTGIAADPKNANIVYVAAAGGGLWKSINATSASPTWTPLTDNLSNNGKPLPEFMGAVAETDATGGTYNGNQIVYAGTGEANNNYDGFYGNGILVSTNSGTSWTLTTGPSNALVGETVGKIVISPGDPTGATAYAAVSGSGIDGSGGHTGIWETTNYGQTWTNVTGAAGLSQTDPWSDVVIDPKTPTTLFAAEGNVFGSSGNGVYRSTNGGTSWTLLANCPSGTQDGRIALALYDKSSTDKLLVAIAQPLSNSSLGGQLFEMLRSTNPSSATPTFTNLNAPNYMGGTQNNINYGQGWYDTTLAIDPANANYFYAGGSDNGGTSGNIESFNGGTSWQAITQDSTGKGPHGDDHAVAFDQHGSLLDGNDGGIFRLNSPTSPSTQTWSDLNTNLQITQFTGVSADSLVSNVVYGGSQDNGTEKYTGAVGWNEIAGGDGGITQVDPSNDTRIYQEYTGVSLNLSTNSGTSFSSISSGIVSHTVAFYAPYTLDASGNVYFGTDYLNYSSNQGGTWSQIGTPNSNGFNPGDAAIDAVAVNPVANSNVVYVSAGGNLYVTQNAQAGGTNVTWTQISLPVSLPTGFGYSGSARNILAVDPSDPTGGTVYVVLNNFGTGSGGHVFKITNFGASAGDITDISAALPNVPVWSAAVSPDGSTVYVGTDTGVYSTSNFGVSWVPFGSGMPNAQVNDLEYVAGQSLLLAGTHGRGAWEISTAAAPVLLTNPTGQTATATQNVIFTATASGTPAPAVQWQLSTNNGSTWSNISGATSPTLALTNVQLSQNGYEYRAVFTNTAGSVTSSAATLTVNNNVASGWTAIGPAPNLGGQTPSGTPVSGRITGIAADPNNANIVYIAAAGGGIWKSTNATSASPTWTPLTDNLSNNGTPLPVFMGAVAETDASTGPHSGNEIVYGGTGEANNSGDSYYGNGILVSTDGGNTWTLTTGPSDAFLGKTVSKIVLDPADTSGATAYAAVADFGANGYSGDAGIWKTTNFGQTWTNMTGAAGLSQSNSWSDVAIDPHTPSTLYGAEGNSFGAAGNGVYRSTDSGTTWTLLANAPNGSGVGRIALAVFDDGTTDRLVVAVAQTYGNGAQLDEIAESSNPTAATPTFTNLNAPNYMGQNGYGQGWYDTSLAIDPGDPNYIYAGGTDNGGTPGNIETFNNGSTWQAITQDSSGNGPHSDDHAAVFDANANLLDGNDGGLFRLNNPNNAFTQTWSDLNTNLQITQFTGVAADTTVNNVVYGGSQDNGTEKYTGSTSWTLIAGGDGGITRVDPTNHNTVYQEYTGVSLDISTNGGSTFSSISGGIVGSNANFYVPYVLDASGNIYYGSNYLNYSSNHGSTWTQIGTPGHNNFNSGSAAIDAIAVNPVTNSNVVYVSAGGHMYVTQNAQAGGNSVTWTQIDLPGGVRASLLNTLAVDPADSTGGTAYAVVNAFTGGTKHVFKTTNFGSTWTDITGNLPDTPVDSVAVSPDGSTVFAGTDIGVYSTSNGGSTWAPFSTGLPNAQVVELEYVASQNFLLAGTHGRGAWETGFGSSTPPPLVTTNPTGLTAQAGQNVTFTATAAGNPAPTVQWQVSTNGGATWTAINGATTTTLTLTAVTASMNSYEYEAVFTNTAGSVTTSAAILFVQFAPTVTTNPNSVTAHKGHNVTFTAAASGNPTATVQWQFSSDGGATWELLTGATSTTLTLTNVQPLQDGFEYEAVFTNNLGTATTNAATLTVLYAPIITSSPKSVTVRAGQNATFTASANGDPTPTVQWRVSTNGGSTWTNISGATSTTLTLTSVTSSMNGYKYDAVFTNSQGSTTSAAATLTVDYAPAVTTNPTSQTVTAGSNVTFTAAATGNPHPTVKWQLSTNGGATWTNISGATSTTLTLTNVTTSMNGYEYRAVFTNSVGSATTTGATLTVTAIVTPLTDTSKDTAAIPATTGEASSTALMLNDALFGQNGYGHWAVYNNANAPLSTTAILTALQLPSMSSAGVRKLPSNEPAWEDPTEPRL